MENTFPISRTLTLVAGAIAIAFCSASASLAQTDSQSGADRAREAQTKVLKDKIDKLQAQLGKLQSAQHGHDGSGTMDSSGNAPEGLAQASPASEPSAGAGSEPPMGGEMGGGSMGGSMEHGEGMGGMGGGGMGGGGMQGGSGGGAQPEASPSAGMGGTKGDM